MSTLYFMVSIVERKRLLELVSIHKENGVTVNQIALGHGTAASEILNMFGLESSEKAVCFSIVTGETWLALRRGLEQKLRIDIPGTGISFLVPMSSIGGPRELGYLTENQPFEKKGESELQGTEHELLVVISNQGYSDMVMDAARKVGAGGGTVIHAKGTGVERAEHFLGISLAAEKDILFIVTPTGRKKPIMESIMREAGMETKAKAICFSLPVTDTAGLRLLEEPGQK